MYVSTVSELIFFLHNFGGFKGPHKSIGLLTVGDDNKKFGDLPCILPNWEPSIDGPGALD